MITTRRSLTLRPLVAALCFMVAGGPYGLEGLLAKAGPRSAVLLLVATPLVWCLPIAFMVGELSAAVPEEGGYYVWVKRALGPFWGYQEAWLSFAASLFDMAIYPTLCVLYLARLFPVLQQPTCAIAFSAALIAAATLVNLLGSRSVGEASFVMTLLLFLPFVAMLALVSLRGNSPSLSSTHPSPTAPTDLLGGLIVAMWNYMGWDNASTVAGEVVDPQRTYPRAVFLAVAIVTAGYVVPCVVVAGSGVDVSQWQAGSWVDFGYLLGGRSLRWAVALGGAVCGFGMLNALVLSYSRLPVVLAQDGYLPAVFARLSGRRGVPVLSVLGCAFAWTLTLGLNFDHLVSLDVLLYGSALVLEFVALTVLRVREPTLPRPYRAPGGTLGTALLGIPPALLLVAALVKNAEERIGSVSALTLGAALIALGPALYTAMRWRKWRWSVL